MRLCLVQFKPAASQVLTSYLKQCNEPAWTSFFVKLWDVKNDQFGKSHFNWSLDKGTNYHILRATCFPFIKYHCTKRPYQNLDLEDNFFTLLKIANLGIPLLFYGLAAVMLITHKEIVKTPQGNVFIYFLYKEDKGSRY